MLCHQAPSSCKEPPKNTEGTNINIHRAIGQYDSSKKKYFLLFSIHKEQFNIENQDLRLSQKDRL